MTEPMFDRAAISEFRFLRWEFDPRTGVARLVYSFDQGPELVDQPIDYADVQGTILRGYRVDHARHFILSITDAAAAGSLIGDLVDGERGLPRITTAERWTTKPDCFVNVGFTAAGLAELGLPQPQLKTFDTSFCQKPFLPIPAG